MASKRTHEGYLMIDHRDSPGVSPEFARAIGAPFVPASTLFESATITCSHCERVVVLNPNRSRERGYCRRCDRYICDQCTTVLAQTGVCRPFKQVLDEAQEQAFRDEQRGDSIIIPSTTRST